MGRAPGPVWKRPLPYGAARSVSDTLSNTRPSSRVPSARVSVHCPAICFGQSDREFPSGKSLAGWAQMSSVRPEKLVQRT